MSYTKTNVIIKEYFGIISPILEFEPCEKTVELEKKVIELLCAVKGEEALVEDCWICIEDAKCLQTSGDGVLLFSAEKTPLGTVYDIKTAALTSSNIDKLRSFDVLTFIDELKTNANLGKINSCKLLAFLSWMGELVPENKETSKNILLSLAINGDALAVDMLIYCFASLGETAEKEKWEHISTILKTEKERFSAVASYSSYSDYSDEEVQTANLIMCITQKNAAGEGGMINRPMTHYVLHSKDDYIAKMDMLSGNINYYLVLHAEERQKNKKYGF